MAFRIDDEDELRALGFREGPDGKWRRPQPNASPAGDVGTAAVRNIRNKYRGVEQKVSVSSPASSSQPQPAIPRKAKRSNKTNQDHERSSERKPRFRIVITIYSRRKIDPDNLFAKYFIDPLVERGIIPDDNSDEVAAVEKVVRRCLTEEEERTEVEVYERGV